MHVVKGRLKNLDGITTCPSQSRSSGGNGTDRAQAAKNRTHSPHTLSSRAFHIRFCVRCLETRRFIGGGNDKNAKKWWCVFSMKSDKKKKEDGCSCAHA